MYVWRACVSVCILMCQCDICVLVTCVHMYESDVMCVPCVYEYTYVCVMCV